MPVRDGRWLSPAKYIEMEKAAKEAAKAAAMPSDVQEEIEAEKPKRSRRSKAAAQAALTEATGLVITLED
jgi:hypothetical protein